MFPGFLGTKAPFMMDLVVLALFAIIPVLIYSIKLAKTGQYIKHKSIQIALAIILLISVILFEIEIRIAGGIYQLIDIAPSERLLFDIVLYTHLFFAITTPLIWGFVIFSAIKNFDGKSFPARYANKHRLWGKIATIDLILTSLTGFLVYYLGFLA